MVRTGATVADACAEYPRYIEQDRQRKPSTLRDYNSIFRNCVLPHLGEVNLEDHTADRVERWAAVEIDPDRQLANRTRETAITVFHGVMERARTRYRLPTNPVADVEKPRTALRTEINVFSPEEVMALVRAADSEQDAAIYLTAALRASGRASSSRCAGETVTSPVRRSASSGIVGGCLDGSALSKRYRAALERAALRPLRFHDLRRTFGTRVIGVADIRRVQEWMGHANVQTTMQYLHYVPRPQDAALVGEAFEPSPSPPASDFEDSGQGRLL